ncbi:MAG: site-specific DNA-methyltransferase [Phycisphaerae bacterium]|nr:site-specific DNA-methyltransferase [Phycisphaerae bacterium]
MEGLRNEIKLGDCIEVLSKIGEPFADLIFADPPFNIGYKYDKYHDKVDKKNFAAWTKDWMAACNLVLKPQGSFYIAIGDEHVADVKVAADELGLEMRNWIIWHYAFGQQMKNKFARSHTHILYFVKDKSDFIFNDDSVRVISDRQKKYQDKRANPEGKMPDDVWDEYPRVCGTFKERTGFPCQMPESILARIIRVSSNKENWVLDPFSGSGTTAVTAHKLNRVYTGIDISEEYVKEAERRIRECKGLPIEGESKQGWNEHLEAELKWLYHENKVPTEQLDADSFLLTLFSEKFNTRVRKTRNPFQPREIRDRLIQMRKSAKLGPLRGHSIPRKPRKSHTRRKPLENEVATK